MVEVGVANYCQVEPGDGEVLIELAEVGAVIGTLSEVWLGCLESWTTGQRGEKEEYILGQDDATCEYVVGYDRSMWTVNHGDSSAA